MDELRQSLKINRLKDESSLSIVHFVLSHQIYNTNFTTMWSN